MLSETLEFGGKTSEFSGKTSGFSGKTSELSSVVNHQSSVSKHQRSLKTALQKVFIIVDKRQQNNIQGTGKQDLDYKEYNLCKIYDYV